MYSFIKFCQSQVVAPGFAAFKRLGRTRCYGVLVLLLVSAFALGVLAASSGNRGPIDLSSVDVKDLSRGELMRYAYDLQNATAENPDALKGMTARDVSLMLAEADLQRQDKPSVVWQYRSESCVLDIYFLAEDVEALETKPIAHYELRERGLVTRTAENPVAAWNCFQSLYLERQKVIEAGFRQIYASLQNDSTVQ